MLGVFATLRPAGYFFLDKKSSQKIKAHQKFVWAATGISEKQGGHSDPPLQF
jgi:hypothetical protein